MGIPRFFYWLYHNYNECLVPLQEKETFKDKNIQIDSYSLDINAIIHPVCQRVYNYGQNTSKTMNGRLLHKSRQLSPVPKEEFVFEEICKAIEALRSIVNPRKQFILAIDGTAGMSKQTQQRQRRFKSAMEKEKTKQHSGFDGNCITTGSEFMYKLSKYIHDFIVRQLNTKEEWKSLEVIFSNEKVEGEGEHKIIHFIKNSKENYSYCIHSPDADLIMLTLGIDKPNIYIMRENIYSKIACKYFVVNVNTFRQSLLKSLKWNQNSVPFSEKYAIYDFILMGFLLGNDFLPHVPSLEISNNGIDIIIESYKDIGGKHGHFTYTSSSDELCINVNSLVHLFRDLALNEKTFLMYKAMKTIQFPDTLLKNNLKVINNNGKFDVEFDFENYRKEYYTQRLNIYTDEDISKLCHEYFKGLLFILRYYLQEIPDWNWFYPYHYCPFFVDMYNHITKFNGEKKFRKNKPLTPVEQLLAVLPPQSAHILPKCFQHLLTEQSSPIIHMYPKEFKIDLEGKHQEWEGHPLLPFIDIESLQKIFQTYEHKMSEYEKKRNKIGKTSKYKVTDNDKIQTSYY